MDFDALLLTSAAAARLGGPGLACLAALPVYAVGAATARAEFPNPGGRIRPGMLMRVAVQQGQRQSAAVPESAVQYEGAGAFVYRIAPGQTGERAFAVIVK